MRYTFVKKQIPSGNPVANALVVIAGTLVIGVSIVLGFFAFVALSALVLVAAVIIGIRVWWLKRKLARQPIASDPGDGNATGGVIEGEFRVIRDDNDEA